VSAADPRIMTLAALIKSPHRHLGRPAPGAGAARALQEGRWYMVCTVMAIARAKSAVVTSRDDLRVLP
jgi:hypothetical protein